MNIGNELGVQSYCFRNFKDNVETAGLIRDCGMDAVELCGIHVDFQQPDTFADVIKIYNDAGIRIVSTGVNGISKDVGLARNLFEFLKAAGTQYMSINFAIGSIPESFRIAERLAAEYDVKLAIHNHGGRHWLGCAETLSWVFNQTSEVVGLNLDTAWALHSHENPIAMAERFADRLYGVHIKDFTFDSAAQHEDVVVGTGNLDLPKFIAKLAEIGFDGFAVLEYEGDVENPVPALKSCVSAVRAACRAEE